MSKSKPQLSLQTSTDVKSTVLESMKSTSSFYTPLSESTSAFYDNFIQQRCLLSATISGSLDIDSQYTVYIIDVRTAYLNYQVKRRFKQFKEFRKHVCRKKSSLGDQREFKHCPKLQDVFFNRLDAEIKAKRIRELQGFLDFFMDAFTKGLRVIGFLQFLEILCQLREKKIDTLLASPMKMSGPTSVSPNKQAQKDGMFFNVSHEKRIFEYLQAIQDDLEIRRYNIKLIGETIAESQPIFKSEFITLIIRGTGQPKEKDHFKGLVHLCGRLDRTQHVDINNKPRYEHTSCQYNLDVLNSVLECEKNPSYELFLKEFQEMPIPLLGNLALDQHILSDRPCKLPALKLFMKFIEGQQRAYSSTDWKFIIQKLKILRYKESVYKEIENYQPGKQLKKAQSSVLLDQSSKKESVYRTSQPWQLSLSYLDQSDFMDDSVSGQSRQMKDMIEDFFAGWTEVYNLPAKNIRIEHSFPQSRHVRMSVQLPLSVKESFNLLVKQRKAWDGLLLSTTSLGEAPNQQQQLNQHRSERVIETYNRGFSKRIQFYCEERIEIEDEGHCIYISRTPFTPNPVPESSDATQVGEWENLIMIKDISNNSSRPIQKWLFPSIDMNTSQIMHDKQVTTKSTGSADPFSAIEDAAGSVTPTNTGMIQPPPMLFNFTFAMNSNDKEEEQKEQGMFFADSAISSMSPKANKNRRRSSELLMSDDKYKLIRGLKHHEISERESESNVSSSSLDESSQSSQQQQSSVASSSSFQLSEVPAMMMSSKQQQQQQQQKSAKSISGTPSQRSQENIINAIEKQRIEGEQSPRRGSLLLKGKPHGRPSIRLVKVAQDGMGSSGGIGAETSILDSSSMASLPATDEVKMPQNSSYMMEMNESATNASLCQVTFLFNLLNQESMYFFSKFILKRDDDSLLKNAMKLLELAQKVRKESASTTDSQRNLRKESNESYASNASEPYLYGLTNVSQGISQFQGQYTSALQFEPILMKSFSAVDSSQQQQQQQNQHYYF